MSVDVTSQVGFIENDGESLPITKCVCGAHFPAWQEIVGIYPDDPWECPHCGCKLVFQVAIKVLRLV